MNPIDETPAPMTTTHVLIVTWRVHFNWGWVVLRRDTLRHPNGGSSASYQEARYWRRRRAEDHCARRRRGDQRALIIGRRWYHRPRAIWR